VCILSLVVVLDNLGFDVDDGGVGCPDDADDADDAGGAGGAGGDTDAVGVGKLAANSAPPFILRILLFGIILLSNIFIKHYFTIS
jgi:hypothetical protein